MGIFEDMIKGNISLNSAEEDNEVVLEAVYPDSIDYLKMLSKQVLLPQGTPLGKGNIAFLYTHNIEESIGIINNSVNCLSKKRYKFYYYNILYFGKIYNKKFRYNMKEERKSIYKKIEDETTIIPKIKITNIGKDNKNMYYDLSKYIEIFTSICHKVQPLRYISMYWDYMSKIFVTDIPRYTSRFVIVDLKNYRLTKNIRENLENPLYLLYYTLLRKPALVAKVNIDFYFFADKKILKINPSKCDEKTHIKLRVEMNKIMKTIVDTGTTLEEITSEENIKKEEMTATVTSEITQNVVGNTPKEIHTNKQLVEMKKVTPVEKEIEKKVKTKVERATKIIGNNPVDNDQLKEVISKNVKKEIDDDHEMIKTLYYQNRSNNTPKKSAASTARDNLLKEEQKNLKIGNMTIDQISRINTNKIEIPITDVSKVVSTTNDNVKQLKFTNFDKTYNDKLMPKDIMNSIMSLNDKSIPMFIRDIKVEDTSDELNYKDTYTIYFEDGNRKRHTVKIDIPKFIDGRFLYVGGNKKIIKHQSFYLPVVKISSDMVQIVTNYSKMTIQRVENKSTSSVERLKKLVNDNAEVKKYFLMSSVFSNNKAHITTVEYDDLSKLYSEYKNGKTHVFFDQTVAIEYMKKNNISEKKNKMYIGKVDGNDTFIDINTQEDDNGKGIIELIVNTLPEEYKTRFGSIKSPKRLMFTKVRIMKQFVNVGMLLGFWEGLSTLIKKIGLKYILVDNIQSQSMASDEEFIKFKDCVMIYKQDVPTALIMNGIRMFDTQNFNMVDFDSKDPYITYIRKVYGRAIIENALMNFYEFAIDPITLEILKEQDLPTDIVSLFIYAVKLLADSQYVNDINQNLSRIRCGEIIPAILYERLAKNYVNFRNSNGRKKYTVPQDCVIKEILGLKTVEDYSTLNPILELDMIHSLSSKGFRGVNLDDAYTMEKRGYDPSMIGIVSPSTPPDGSVGISRTLTMEPNITNLRGMVEDSHENLDELKDVNLFSPAELVMPLATTIDDPNRLGHATKQSRHVIPVKKSSPVLISNGVEETVRFQVTSNFAINAEDDGEIIDYDEVSKIMIAKYKNGKCRAIDLSPNIVKNGGGGFFLSNILATELKVGDKFKKNDVLAYHKDFFKNDKFNNCRMNMGPLVKIALMSTYNTYEDATMITHKMSEDCATEMCFCKSAVIGKNSNVFYMVKKGQEILVGDPLIQFDTSYEDETINALLANLGEEDKKNILEGARNEIKSKYSGVIEDIKIYSTVDLEEMNPSLRKIVSAYYRGINKRKDFLDKYDPDNKKSIVKCGMLFNETSHKVQPNRFGVIKGEHVEDGVLIEFYIKHSEPLEVGSKIAHFTALKNTIAEIVPEGYEPYSNYRPDEEIGTLLASNSVLNRMTPSITLIIFGNKCIIELKRHLAELNMDRKKMEKMIYDFFSAFDKSGSNTQKYKNMFQPMSDTEFKKYFTEFFNNEDAYLILDIIDYERTISMEDIEDAAKVIDVPLFEYVTLPHLTMDKSKCITTKIPVPVGYINEKRTQQTVMKKNGISTDISERSAIINQVTGKDKNGRESDLENTMLTMLGMHNTLKELNAPRADDSVMKQQMLRDIALNGYTRLEDMEDDILNKTTLNTVDCYFTGMSIKTDLVMRGLMLPSRLREEL